MEKKSHCNCKCHKNLESINSEQMISPIPLKSLSSCKTKNKEHLLNNTHEYSKTIKSQGNDGDFIDYSNTSFSSEGPIKYGEEQDVDDL
ncbi:MAG: hypothetical protein ACRDAU_04670 [Clostridium sp.]